MKKIVLVLILVGALGAGTYYWKSSNGDKKDGPEIMLVKIERGPLEQIVGTTGKVVSNLDVDIKCKASGEVLELPYDISDSVKEKAVLVKLDPKDMDRVVKQETVALEASQARLATAKENLLIAERTLKTDRERAEANLASAEMSAKDARAKADRVRQLFEKKLASQEEVDTAETAATQAVASLTGAKIKLDELETQEQALEVSRQNVKLAQTQVDADTISLQIAQDRLSDCTVLAPMDGVVTARPVQTGMIIASGVSNVGGGTSIMTLSDISRIFVLASVDESDIGKIREGQSAVISVDAYPTMQFAGKVVRIASKGVNTQNVVTFEVKIEVLGGIRHEGVPGTHRGEGRGPETRPAGELARRAGGPNAPASQRSGGRRGGGRFGAGSRPGGRGPRMAQAEGAMQIVPEQKNLLKPEMTANIEITTAERSNALLIPVESVSRLSGEFFANVPGTDPTAPDVPEKKPIEIGITDGEYYELLAGLNEGDTVMIRRGEVDSRWANNNPRGGARNTMRMMRMGSRGGR
jgi:multidrug resistance efflux pump